MLRQRVPPAKLPLCRGDCQDRLCSRSRTDIPDDVRISGPWRVRKFLESDFSVRDNFRLAEVGITLVLTTVSYIAWSKFSRRRSYVPATGYLCHSTRLHLLGIGEEGWQWNFLKRQTSTTRFPPLLLKSDADSHVDESRTSKFHKMQGLAFELGTRHTHC